MSCTVTLSGHKIPCPRVSGLLELYLVDKAALLAADSYTYAIESGELTITPGSPLIAAYKIELTQNSAGLTQPITSDNDARTGYIDQTLEIRLDGISAANSYLASEMMKGTFEAVAVTREGEKIYLGYDNNAPTRGLEISGGDGGATGMAAGDANGFSATLTFQSKISAPLLAAGTDISTIFDVTTA